MFIMLIAETGERQVCDDITSAKAAAQNFISRNVASKIEFGGGLVPIVCEYWCFPLAKWVHQQNAAQFKWEHTRT